MGLDFTKLRVLPLDQRKAYGSRLIASLGSAHSKRAYRRQIGWLLDQVAFVPTNAAGRPLYRFATRGDAVPVDAIDWSALSVEGVEHVRAVLQGMVNERSCALATANLRLVVLRGLLSYAETLSEASRRATRAIKGSRLPRPERVDASGVEALLRVCLSSRQEATGIRDAALIGLLASGFRRSEVGAVAVDGLVHELDGRWSIRLIGKGNRERQTPLHPTVAGLVLRWLEIRGREPGPLLLKCRGGQVLAGQGLDGDAIYECLARRVEEAGLEAAPSPHDLRRWLAGEIIDVGGELTTAAHVLGHGDLRSIQRYDTRAARRARVVVERVSFPSL